MNCKNVDILAYIEGRPLSEAGRQHLQQCPDCRAEAERLLRTVELLQGYFARKKELCPELDELIDCAAGEGRDVTKKHLGACADCRSRVEAIADFLADFKEPRSAQALEPLPPAVKKRLALLRKEHGAARLTRTIAYLKDLGRSEIDKARGLAEQILTPGHEGQPAAASPKDITRVRKKGRRRKPGPAKKNSTSGEDTDSHEDQ